MANETARIKRCPKQADPGFPLLQKGAHLLAVAAPQHITRTGVLFQEAGHQPGQQGLRRHGGSADAHRFPAFVLPHLLQRLTAPEDLLCRRINAPAVLRQRKFFARAAQDQLCAQRLLQRLDMHAYGGLCEVQPFRRTRKAAVFRGGRKGFQLPQTDFQHILLPFKLTIS